MVHIGEGEDTISYPAFHEPTTTRGRKEGSPRSVLSMILKLQTLLRKSDARGAYGLKGRCVCGAAPFVRPFVWPFATGV